LRMACATVIPPMPESNIPIGPELGITSWALEQAQHLLEV
jgi:hypothetical protein